MSCFARFTSSLSSNLLRKPLRLAIFGSLRSPSLRLTLLEPCSSFDCKMRRRLRGYSAASLGRRYALAVVLHLKMPLAALAVNTRFTGENSNA